MSRKKKYQNTKKSEIEEGLENIEESLTKTEQFIENNQGKIITAVLAIAVVVLGYFAFQKFYKGPQEEKALNAMYQAEEYFRANSFRLALDGTDKVGKQVPGFLKVIDDYSGTKAGELAQYYAGICYKNLGEYEKAIAHLKDFSSEDYFLQSIAISSQGDCYFGLGKYEDAAEAYEKAAEINPNNFSTPIYLQREGLALEKLGKPEEAVKVYEELKTKYPFTVEGRDIDKYIIRAKLAARKG